MFNANFYPTPPEVIDRMTFGLDLFGKTILEPSAGSGNIIEYAKKLGAFVMACELDRNLSLIAAKKADQFLCPNFFDVKADQVSHIDFILMNPPFDIAYRHIDHAWEIAPEGCTIVALCNEETIKNRYSSGRTRIGELIEKNGGWESLGNVFNRAERTTDVSVALVKMFKPKTGDYEFNDFLFDIEDDQEDAPGPGIMRHDEIREIVGRYIGAVNMFESVIDSSKTITDLINPISDGLGISFGAQSHGNHNTFTAVTRDVFKKQLQKSAWKSIFNKMNLHKYVTRSVMEDINKFVEQQQNVPFTMKNIYSMIELIFLSHGNRMDKVLVDAFDRICSLSADNSEAGEKWKTNSNYKVNRRFIDTYICEYDTRYPSSLTNYVKIKCGAREESLNDIIKALCFITGKNYEDVNISLWSFFRDYHVAWGHWIQWNEFFMVRGYKKGTMHFEFVNQAVWMEFNRRVAKIKGWQLPTKTDHKQKGTERTRKEKFGKFKKMEED